MVCLTALVFYGFGLGEVGLGLGEAVAEQFGDLIGVVGRRGRVRQRRPPHRHREHRQIDAPERQIRGHVVVRGGVLQERVERRPRGIGTALHSLLPLRGRVAGAHQPVALRQHEENREPADLTGVGLRPAHHLQERVELGERLVHLRVGGGGVHQQHDRVGPDDGLRHRAVWGAAGDRLGVFEERLGGLPVAVVEDDGDRLTDRARADPPRAQADRVTDQFAGMGFDFGAGIDRVADAGQIDGRVDHLSAECLALGLAGLEERADERGLAGPAVPEQQHAGNGGVGQGVRCGHVAPRVGRFTRSG